MTKPKLDESARSDELGAVASFAMPPLRALDPDPTSDHPPSPVATEAPGLTAAIPNGDQEQPSRLAVAAPAAPLSIPTDPPIERPGYRPYQRASRRTTWRRSFEFYTDQIVELRRLSLEEKARGDDGNMSKMVRNAVDAYIEGRRQRT